MAIVVRLPDDYHAGCSGDEAAFSRFVLATSPRLRRFVGVFLSDAGAVEDVLQKTFLQAYRQQGSFPNEGALLAWLFGTARNLTKRELSARGRQSNAFHVETLESGCARLESLESGRTALERDEASQRLRAAVDAMPDYLREIVYLRYDEGLSVAEISAALGISAASARQYISRVHKALRALLKNFDF